MVCSLQPFHSHISAPYCSVDRTSASYNRTYFGFNEEQCQRDLNDYASNDVGLLFDLTPYTIPDIWLIQAGGRRHVEFNRK